VPERGKDFGTSFLDLISSAYLSFAQQKEESGVCRC